MDFIYRLLAIPQLRKYAVGGVVVVSLIFSMTFLPAWMRLWAVIGLVAAGGLMVLFNVGLKQNKKRKASAFDKGLQADANKPGRGKAESRKAVSELSERWNNAVNQLKGAGLSLYDLPWYLLIGEPQSGKSTTLKNSGLEFPVGTDALSGAGGTRNCDWWFTNEAIILDTAGRFTFQEKNAPDAEEWNGFLKMLKKNRAACPINGVVVTIPCTSLLGDPEDVREEKARNIREKLTQIQRTLEVQFPVFILITKSDQILGFTEFFSRLGATEQRQLLGWSMHGPFIQAYDPGSFDNVFQNMYERIHKLRLKLLGEDMSLTEIDKLYVFPEEFKSLREPLGDYLKSVFIKTHYLPPLFFRGFYFTSGLQQGKPIARACADMIRRAGAGAEEIVEHLQKIFERSRAFFIRDFYLEKLFPERNLVIHSEQKLKMSSRLAKFALIGGVILLLATLGFIGWRGWELRKGVGGIRDLAQKVNEDFKTERNRVAQNPDNAKSPEAMDDALELAGRFDEASQKTVEKIPALTTDLRDMYWIYFIQNLLQDHGRALYAQLDESAPLASVSDAEIAAGYRDYARQWSVNAAWVEHALGRSGGFPEVESIMWPGASNPGPQEEGALEGGEESKEIPSETGALLKRLKEILAQDLEFNEQAAYLPLIPGDANPRENDPIVKEVEAIAKSFPAVDTTTVQQIVSGAEAFRQRYDQLLPQVLEWACGYSDPQADPYAAQREAIGALRAAVAELKGTLGNNSAMLVSAGAGDDAVAQKFDQLAWTEAAIKGQAKRELDEYVEETVEETAERLRRESAQARQPLNNVGDVLTSGTLSPALVLADEGLTRLEALSTAQNAKIAEVAGMRIPNPDEIRRVADQWQQSPEPSQALVWVEQARQHAATPDGVRWRLGDLAAVVERAVNEGQNAVHVEAWLAYARTVQPGALLTNAQIGGATLTDEPPTGARPEGLTKADEEIQKLIDELTGFKAEVTCEPSIDRLRVAQENLEGLRETNRRNFVQYWQTAYNRWSPEAWIAGINSWGALKGETLFQGTALSQRIKNDLQRLVTNLQAFKQKDGTLTSEMDAVLTAAAQFVAPGSSLEQNANQFNQVIDTLDPSELKASTQLKEEGGRLDKQLDLIATQSSTLNSKFEPYPRKVRSLLGGAYGQFEQELDAFMRQWAADLAGRFPFAVPSSAIKVASDQVTIPQAEAERLQAFFFGPESLDTFVEPYRALYDRWLADPQNAGPANFIKQTQALRDYFFSAEGQYRVQQIEGTYDGFDGKSVEDLRNISELLTLTLPSASTEPESARWRSQVPGSKTPFKWAPGNYGEQSALVFRSELGQRQGAVPNTAQLRVGGEFSVLAYIVTQSPAPEAERRRWPVKFGVRPEGINRDQLYKISFVFVLDRPMPTLPDWSSAPRWAR